MEDITTILFDVDGTILDTHEFILQATEYALSALGKPIPARSVISKHVGETFENYYSSIAGPGKHVQELMKLHHNFQLSHFHLAKLFPNALETLKTLHKKGYKLGVVTSRLKKTSLQTLTDCGVIDFFDVVVSGDDVKALKPDPTPLLFALKHLKKLPENTVMVGDSHFDVQAGKNAGTKTIRATYGFHTDHLHNPEPDFFIDDIKDLLKLL